MKTSGKNLIICPVYNEQDTVEEFYRSLRDYYSQDVLFVDDGSTDGSRHSILGMRGKNTFVIRHLQRRGYGEALISGFNFAKGHRYENIVTLDADLQHNPRHIPLFLRQLLEAEVALGSRYIRIGRCLDIPRERLLINRYISRMLKAHFSFNFTDPFCGYRAYRLSFLERAKLNEASYGLSLEILLEIIRIKADFKEFPIETIYFNPNRKFLDGLNDAGKRLHYYLEIVSRKNKEIKDEEKVFSSKPSSR